MRWMILVTLAVLVAFSGQSFAQGGGYLAPDDEQKAGKALQVAQLQNDPAPEQAPEEQAIEPAYQAPKWETREGVEEAAKKVEQLTGAGYNGAITVDTGRFREVFIGNRRLVLNQSGRVVGVGKRAVPHARIVTTVPRISLKAFRHEWNKQARRAGVVSGSYVDAHDGLLQGEIDSLDGRVSRNGWLGAIALIIALVAAALGLSRLPRWQRVHY